MKILVTGGAGFIGSHIVEGLIKKGHQVMILDDFSAGSKKFVHPKAAVVRLDIRDAKRVSGALTKFRPTAVYHLAAAVNLRSSLAGGAADDAINLAGALNVLAASQRSGVKQFIFASSAAVYGHKENFPLTEKERLTPASYYGAAKASFENYLSAYHHQFDLKTVILRFSNVYGPRQGTRGEGGVVAIFCKNLLAGKPLTIFGRGEQTRDFIFVDDVVRASLAALACQKSWAVYNVSTQQASTVNELARRLLKISGRKVSVKHVLPLAGEVKHSVLSNRLIKQELGWSPQVSLEEGLRRTWGWFKERY